MLEEWIGGVGGAGRGDVTKRVGGVGAGGVTG
jgi:hypothetical protein